MKATLINRRLTLASVAFAGIALASGCCTKHSSQPAYYSAAESSGGSAPAQEYTAQPAPAEEISSTNGNTVIPLYKESVNIGKREVDAGSVTVKKIVKTETINQPVELRHEEIVVERQPASGSVMDTTSAFQEGETTVHLTREEPVITKETTSAGQVVLKQTSSSEQTTVKATQRTEDVAVTKNGENVTIQGNMGAAESSGGQTSGASSSGTITDPSMLAGFSEDPSTLSGRSVQFSNLRVQNVVDDNVALLSTGSGQTIYAFCSQGAASLKPGDNVNLSGTVKSSAAGLSGDAAKVLSSQPMYIDAQKIEANP
jgi:uncharacterized protein (TIGR02271 family)